MIARRRFLYGLAATAALFTAGVAIADDGGCFAGSRAGNDRIISAGVEAAGIVEGLTADLGECTLRTLEAAPPGSFCHVGALKWQVEVETYPGNRPYRVYRDIQSGLTVTAPLDGELSHGQAMSRCGAGYRLPSGYSSSQNGDYGFPNHDSDFETLRKDGLRMAVPGLRNRSFWSSSVLLNGTEPGTNTDDYAYALYGSYGGMETENRNWSRLPIVCVKGPEYTKSSDDEPWLHLIRLDAAAMPERAARSR